jgi:DNA-binding transcriptional ArsR family regulator
LLLIKKLKRKTLADLTPETEMLPILPDNVPVTMPDLPVRLTINSLEQFKAMSDPVRMRILRIIRHQPATAKQLAERLGATPGAIGYHLHVLEAAGLAQVVALRVTRGIIARYYTRTARIFMYDMPQELTEAGLLSLKFLTDARDELADAFLDYKEDADIFSGFPHARISREKAEAFAAQLKDLIENFLQEPDDPEGEVYGISIALFKAPAWQGLIKDKDTK